MVDNLKDKIEKYVTDLFRQNPSPALKFHNLSHTKKVVKNAMSIAEHCNVSENEMFIIYAAAWFHDTGYLFTEPQYHEKESCLIMEKLAYGNIDDLINMAEVKQCIMATKVPQSPQNMLQNIIADADVYHFGSKEFLKINHRMLEEFVLKTGKVDTMKFTLDTIEMLKEHHFFTEHCRELLNTQKAKNIIELEKKLYI